jgi:hypothetical protein
VRPAHADRERGTSKRRPRPEDGLGSVRRRVHSGFTGLTDATSKARAPRVCAVVGAPVCHVTARTIDQRASHLAITDSIAPDATAHQKHTRPVMVPSISTLHYHFR